MGIRFYCPNGHRLHVKEFLAGKKGICPHCDARFRIPAASEIPHGAPRLRPDLPATGPMEGAPPVADLAVGGAAVVAVPEGPAVETAVVASPVPDPIAEAPAAVWYVRPPSGGQFGPAAGDVMQRWLAEGRVSPDTLVWREGWPEWLLAGPLFPQLSAPAAEAANGPATADPDTGPVSIVVPESPRGRTTRSTTPARRKPESRSKSAVALVVTLLSMVLVLLIVLVLVVRGAA